ncbi:hypothetical protein FF2_037333 [Malus domestica]
MSEQLTYWTDSRPLDTNLKTLFLDHESFAGFFPPLFPSLCFIRTLDFSYNNLTGSLPIFLITDLDRLCYLRLKWKSGIPVLGEKSEQSSNL